MTTLAMNGRRRTAFGDSQYISFFERTRLPTEARRRTSVTGRRIFLPAMAKARLESIETPVGDSRDPARAKVLTVSLREFYPTDM